MDTKANGPHTSPALDRIDEAIIEVLRHQGRITYETVSYTHLRAHEMGFARQVSSQVLFLHQGRVEEQGSAEILDQPQSERLQQFLSNRLK